ncbi:MAG: hypothetical protein KKD31_01890 [Bacteroidetes bacterium]|nr:hypothetical protein [Bacteroidota bacterium]
MSRLSSPLVMLGLNFFLPSVVIVNVISYLGFWKFYKMLAQIYKQNFDILKFAAFFIPSVVFWGSGIMKDTYTITAVLWFTYTVYMVFVKKQRQRTNICLLLLNAWIIIMLKPYIFLALLPSTFFWLSHKWTTGIKNKLMRSLVAPGLLAVGFLVSLGILSIIGNSLGRYSDADSIMKKAKATQQDLIRGEQYGENYFDIGEYDFTPASLVSKVPAAITAGIFRPFLWEAKNIVMLISGLENFIILLVFGIMIFRVGLIYLVGIVRSDPFLMFSFFFVIIIAFSVGLTTANFGALVRYRIPLMPFLVVLVLELWHQKKMKSEKELQLTSSKHLDQIS